MTAGHARTRHSAALHLVVCLGLVALLVSAAAPSAPGQAAGERGRWIALFNGKNLDGWTPKFTGHALGENYAETFRVEKGVLKVSYDRYKSFDGTFGHLFYRQPFSEYRLRVEYRFVGEQCPGGPEWGRLNSGVMLHSQSPESMRREQQFPVSVEVQFLGAAAGDAERPTGNLCTPGTHVVLDGKLFTTHCLNSRSKTFRGDQWVIAEVEVLGGSIRHFVNGEQVLEYAEPQLDETDPDGKRLIGPAGKVLRGGYIALQAESHPLEIRRVEILPLGDAGR